MANAAVDAKVNGGGISRREFLYYIWGASIAIYTAQFSGLLIWFLIPRFREGEFGGLIPFDVGGIPAINDAPVDVPAGRFWMVNLDTADPNDRMYLAEDESEPIAGIAAIYKVCTHLGCIYAWVSANQRFECPCHGSKYRLDGRRIESPAPRSLDRFKVIAYDAADTPIAESPVDELGQYAPLVLPENTAVVRIDTGDRQNGAVLNLLCQFTNNCP